MIRAYFAYGSNLGLPRLRARVPGAERVGAASLSGYELAWNKQGADGSAKCNIMPRPGAGSRVHGALFELPEAGRRTLDRTEVGYRRIEVEVELDRGLVRAFSYGAEARFVDDSLTPFLWYRDLVVAGAEAAGLPADYVSELRETTAAPDPDVKRAARHRSLLCALGMPSVSTLRTPRRT
jgi:gamma-glutamylcyclotransferase